MMRQGLGGNGNETASSFYKLGLSGSLLLFSLLLIHIFLAKAADASNGKSSADSNVQNSAGMSINRDSYNQNKHIIDEANVDGEIGNSSNNRTDLGQANNNAANEPVYESNAQDPKEPSVKEAALASSTMSASSSGSGGGVARALQSDFSVKAVEISQSGNSGAAITSIPIIVPPGRKGIEPKLSLVYNSGSGNGWVGMGWSLGIGAIQRNAKRGVNYNANDYLISINGSISELMPRNDWGSNFFGAKIESAFSRYYRNMVSGGWEKMGKDGTKYYFGSSSASRQDNPNNSSQIFKWCLDRIEDTNGNYIDITYMKDRGAIYPDEIKYTGNTAGLPPSNTVKFILESAVRTDAYEVFNAHYSVTTAYRLKTIEVYGSGALTSSYELRYQYSAGTGRSLLGDVIQYGSNGGEFLTSTFKYLPINRNFNYATWSQNNFGISPDSVLMVGDFNGDGRSDAAFPFFFDYGNCRTGCQQGCEPDCTYSCENSCEDDCLDLRNNCESNCDFTCVDYCDDYCITYTEDYCINYCDNDCEGDSNCDSWCIDSCIDSNLDTCIDDCEVSCGDACVVSCDDSYQVCSGSCDSICYDQCTDMCDDSCDQSCWASCGDYCDYYLDNDNMWAGISGNNNINYTSWHQGEIYSDPYETLSLGDFNGDGKSDVVYYEYGKTKVFVSNGGGFNHEIWSQTSFGVQPYKTLGVGDFNGDGKNDVVFYYENSNTWVGISDGSSFTYTIWSQNSFGTQPYETFGVGDFNGDGLSDVVFYYENGNTWVGISDGSSFTYTIWSQNSFGTQPYETFGVGDFNGDGLSDIAFYYENGNTWVGISDGSSFTYTIWSQNAFRAQPYETFRVGDFNGDGLSDVVFYYDNGNTWAGTSSGKDFTYSIWSSNSFGMDPKTTFRIGDFNGDGKSDVAYYYEDGSTWVGISGSDGAPDLLHTASNTLGSVTTLTYQPSSAYNNTLLPFIVQNVSSITVYDGVGNTLITDYEYSGGYFDHTEREFRGFEYVTASLPSGSLHAATQYHQDDIFKGLPAEKTIKDSFGVNYNIYSKTQYTYVSDYAPDAIVDFPRLDYTDSFICDGNCTEANIATLALKLRTEVDYDIYGNITDKKFYRDLNFNLVDKREHTQYYSPTQYGQWLPSLPEYTQVYDGVSTKIAQSNYAYYSTTGSLQSETKWLDIGTSDPVTSFTYDLYGNVDTITDPAGTITKFAYDTATSTFPVKVINDYGVLGYFTEMTYDPIFIDKVHIEKDYNGHQTQYDYDEFGRIENITKPNPYGKIKYTYDDINRVKTVELMDAGINILQWQETYYDGLGRTITEKSYGTGVSTIIVDTEYNDRGQVFKTSNPYFNGTPPSTVYTYDALNRLVSILNPDGTSSSINYDRGFTSYINENGHRKDVEKDVYGQIVAVDEYTGDGSAQDPYVPYATTTYQYDVLGNLEMVIDDQNNVTAISYDSLSRKIDMDDPDMGVWYYEYDVNGNLMKQTDAKGQIINFDPYDALNRVTKKNYPDGSYIQYDYDEAFSTNSIGLLTTVTELDSTGATKLITKAYYDVLGQSTRTDKIIGGTTYTTLTEYDVLERVNKVTHPAPGNTIVNYSYDGHGNIDTILSGGTAFITYDSYNAFAQPLQVTFGNDIITDYTYDPTNNHLNTIITTSLTLGVIMSLDYSSYDGVGNILQIVDNVTATKTRDFKYDELNRLIEADSLSYGGKLIYQYDSIGNMTYNCRVGHYTHDPLHPHAVKEIRKTDGTLAASYIYDENGNMINSYEYDDNGIPEIGKDRVFTYDYDNMPTSIMKGGGEAVAAIYDAFGSRIQKATPAEITTYITPSYECTGGACTLNIISGTQLIASLTGSEIFYYHIDHLGSSSIITDSDGMGDEVVQNVYYYPYGEIKENISPLTENVDVRYKYTGKEWDGESGLYYYGARYYDPKLTRFISADTIIPDLINPQSLNRYSYVANNPINLIDPTGNYYEETENGYQEYVGPSIEANMERDAFLSELYYASGEDIDFSGLIFIPITFDYVFQSSHWLRSIVPGQIQSDHGWTAFHNGRYGESALHFTAMLGEQVLTVLTWGSSSSYSAASKRTVSEGIKVYRVWGGKSGPWGESWTTVNPNNINNFRSASGLPDVNQGRFVSEGMLKSKRGITARSSLKIKLDQKGGLPELVIKTPKNKVKLQRVSGANPEF